MFIVLFRWIILVKIIAVIKDSSYFCYIYLTETISMKLIKTSFFRAITAVIVGVLLIMYREETITWLTISIGILFFLSGLITCIIYFVTRNAESSEMNLDSAKSTPTFTPSFPLVGMGSLLLGLILALMPNSFVNWMVYILGALLILGAIGQYVLLASIVKLVRINIFFWIMSSVILLIGVVSIIKPMWIASAPLLILGWSMILYGVVECIDTIKIMKTRRQVAHMMDSQSSAVTDVLEDYANETVQQSEVVESTK